MINLTLLVFYYMIFTMQANNHHIIIPSVETACTHTSQGLAQTVPPSRVTLTHASHSEAHTKITMRFTQLSRDLKLYDTKLNTFLGHGEAIE